jgi:tyrosinase
MSNFVSNRIPRPNVNDAYSRADLVFYGVDHSGLSFEARIFLNNPKADTNTPKEPKHGHAGSFYIFGHGGCFGELGHCDVPTGSGLYYDHRLTHQLQPQIKSVDITEALNVLPPSANFTVTVVPVLSDYGRLPVEIKSEGPLKFDAVRLVTYE